MWHLPAIAQASGLAGLALAILLLLFKDVIGARLFPRLTRRQAFVVLLLLAVGPWVVAVFSVLASKADPALGIAHSVDDNSQVVSSQSAQLIQNIQLEAPAGPAAEPPPPAAQAAPRIASSRTQRPGAPAASPSARTQPPESTVYSVGQSGGITADSVVINEGTPR